MKKLLIFFLLFLHIQFCFAGEVIDLEKIVVTPYRSEATIFDVNRGIAVITREEIEASGVNYLPQLFKNKSGIMVTEQLGNAKGNLVDMRGFGEASSSNVLVLVDGRRTNQIDLSGVDWGQIDVDSIEKIEIVRGPSTVLYGDNASGGIINIITRKGLGEEIKVSLGNAFGSYKYKRVFSNLTIGNELLDCFLAYSHQETSGYRANNNYWENNYFGKINFYPSDTFEIEFSSGYHRDRYGMPGALYPFEIESVGRRGTTHPDDRGSSSEYFTMMIPKLSFSISESDVMLSFFTSFRERRSKGLSVYSNLSEYETVHHISTCEFRPKLEVDFALANTLNKFILGVDYFRAKDDILSGNRVGAQQDEADIYKETLGIYVHDNLELYDEILFDVGGRFEWADYTFNQKQQVANYDTKDIKNKALNLGLGYKYDDTFQIYFEYVKSYRMPNTEEYYQNKYLGGGFEYGGLNSGLKAQEANNYELGIKHNSFKWLELGSGIFLMDVKSEIYYDPNTFKNDNYKPKIRHYGFELEANFNLLDNKLRPFFAYTTQESFFKGGSYAGNQVPLVPKTQLSGGIQFRFIERLNWGVSFNYVGSRYAINDQRNINPKLKSYTVFNTTINYQIKNAKLWFVVENMFNREYSAYGIIGSQGMAYYPSPGRTFEAGITWEF